MYMYTYIYYIHTYIYIYIYIRTYVIRIPILTSNLPTPIHIYVYGICICAYACVYIYVHNIHICKYDVCMHRCMYILYTHYLANLLQTSRQNKNQTSTQVTRSQSPGLLMPMPAGRLAGNFSEPFRDKQLPGCTTSGIHNFRDIQLHHECIRSRNMTGQAMSHGFRGADLSCAFPV